MDITDIKIRKAYNDSRLKALISLTFDDVFAVHDIKVIEGNKRLFVAMPSRRDESGTYRDICHPITSRERAKIEEQVLSAYEDYEAENKEE